MYYIYPFKKASCHSTEENNVEGSSMGFIIFLVINNSNVLSFTYRPEDDLLVVFFDNI